MDQPSDETQPKAAEQPAVYYHFAPLRLQPGSIIAPGNYGRFVRRYQGMPQGNQQAFGNPWVLAREMLFELVRVKSCHQKPSRLECAFCLPGRDHAEAYRAKVDLVGIQVLHQVELVEPNLSTHVASMQFMDFPDVTLRFMDATEMRAAAYWSGVEHGILEVLTLSPLRVTANID